LEPEKKLENKNNGQEYQKAQPPVFERKGKSIIHQGKEYIPAGEIAREFSYALSHVSLLARQQKIDAVWTGKRWYVNKDSVLQYRARLAGQQAVLLPRDEVLRGSASAPRQTVLSSPSNLRVNSSSETGEYLSRRANLLKAAVGLIALGGLLIFLFSTISITKPDSSSSALISFSLPSYIKNIPSVLKQIANNLFSDKDQALQELIRKVSELERPDAEVSRPAAKVEQAFGKQGQVPSSQRKGNFDTGMANDLWYYSGRII